MENHQFRPESLMMSYGYKPELSEGAINVPYFKLPLLFSKMQKREKDFLKLLMALANKDPVKNRA